MRALLLILFVSISLNLYAANNKIEVQASGFKNDRGQVMLALHDNADSFPAKPKQAIQTLSSKISNRQAKFIIEDVEPGIYAIAVFHDENGNNILDSNFIGIPKEGVGVSNNAKGSFGPPKFDDAKFQFDGGVLQVNITVSY